MSVKLYGTAGSPNVRGAMLGLAEKGVEYEFVSLMPPAWKTPEHLARNPFGKVPVLEHDGFEVFETQAILRYLDQTFPGPALQPTNAREGAWAHPGAALGSSEWSRQPSSASRPTWNGSTRPCPWHVAALRRLSL
ncbi:glutathione S-transferase family protein [Mesorhizobium salmacidum]|uniref:glutathione S-transferase family protein n=1 Tax=Mesorhizobium salmacidum TaxID=3015171 RepID=UPI0039F5B430